jgi:hypothetical protein
MEEGILFSAVHLAGDDKCVVEYLRGPSRTIAQSAKTAIRGLPTRSAGEKRSFQSQKLVFHCRTSTEKHLAVAVCATREDFPQATVFDCLAQLLQKYQLQRDDPLKLEESVRMITDNFSDPNNNKLAKLQKQVDDVKGVMIDNIDKVLVRGDDIDDMCERTSYLAVEADRFQDNATQLKRAMWKKKLIMYISGAVVILVVIFVLVVVLCHKDGINFDKCKADDSPAPAPAPAAPATTAAAAH